MANQHQKKFSMPSKLLPTTCSHRKSLCFALLFIWLDSKLVPWDKLNLPLLQGYFLALLLLNWLVAGKALNVIVKEGEEKIGAQDGSSWTVLSGSKFPVPNCIVRFCPKMPTARYRQGTKLAFLFSGECRLRVATKDERAWLACNRAVNREVRQTSGSYS